MVASDGRRPARVAERVRDVLAEVLGRVVNDPRLRGLTVTNVEITDDLRMVRVGVRTLETDVTEARRKEILKGLERALGVIRRELTARAQLRYAPELRFHYDAGGEAQTRIDELLAEIATGPRSADG
jgi:ribosome-binding factor A